MIVDPSYRPEDYESEIEEYVPNEDKVEQVKRSIFEIRPGVNFTPTLYQLEIHKHFTQRGEDGKFETHLEGDGTIHRRFGKTVGNLKGVILPWLLENDNCLILHVFPTLTQGRAALWNGKGRVTRNPDEHAMPYLELLPKELWKKKNNAEMSLELINGSIYRVVGAIGKDGTGDHLRGLNALGIICDEFHSWKRDITTEIFSPMVAQNGGFIFRIGTPSGENHGYKRYITSKQRSEHDHRVKTWHLTIDQTYYNDGSPIITKEFIERELASGVDPEIIKQEYYCDFKATTSAAYYKFQMSQAEDDKRICHVPHDPRYPVFRFWDLGKNGTNAAWDVQFPDHNKINCIGYDCDPEMSLYQMHIKLAKDRPYLLKKNFYPWDGNSPESTGMTKLQFVREMGIREEIEVIKRTGTAGEGVEYAKALFNKCWFDEEHCYKGVQALKNYQKTVSSTTNNFGEALKNEHIHGADAFRTMATAYARNEIPIGKVDEYWEHSSQDEECFYQDLEL